MYSIAASSCSSVRSLIGLLCWTLCAWDQQRQNLQVRSRLCSAHTFNRLRTAVPKVSQQCRNELVAVTRADRRADFEVVMKLRGATRAIARSFRGCRVVRVRARRKAAHTYRSPRITLKFAWRQSLHSSAAERTLKKTSQSQ
jgi:hypothetical protein